MLTHSCVCVHAACAHTVVYFACRADDMSVPGVDPQVTESIITESLMTL